MDLVMDGFPKIKPITSQAQVDALTKIAAADGHRVLAPTHVFVKGDEVIGYASICAMLPLFPPGAPPRATQINVWFHSQRFHARDSFNIINVLENIAWNGCPAPALIVPCTKESPFYKHMPALKYSPVMETVLWGKVRE